LKRLFRKAYNFLAKKVCNKFIRLFSDVTILIASSYLMVKKITDFSISGWLLNNAFHQPVVNIYVVTSLIILIIAIISKVITLIVEQFPPVNHNFVEPDEMSNCLYRMNSEIACHLNKLSLSAPVNVKNLCDQHTFDQNLALIVGSLAEHIKKSVPNINVKNKDIFVSLYEYKETSKELVYVLHFDPKKDLVASKVIELEAQKYLDYESVKCIKSPNTTAYVLDKSKYAKGASKRFKTVEHYIGSKLASEHSIYGFLNIEFHNSAIFNTEDEMKEFMEEHIFPFKLLLEYQFLKRHFFSSFQTFEKNWRLK
jgi:hypothetical protein